MQTGGNAINGDDPSGDVLISTLSSIATGVGQWAQDMGRGLYAFGQASMVASALTYGSGALEYAIGYATGDDAMAAEGSRYMKVGMYGMEASAALMFAGFGLAFAGSVLESVGAVAGALAGAAAPVAQVTTNRELGEKAVDEFIEHIEGNGMQVVGREVSVRTPFGLRRYDVVVRNPVSNELEGIEIKSSLGALDRWDAAAKQQFSADRWVNQFGAYAVGKWASIGRIVNTTKILWTW